MKRTNRKVNRRGERGRVVHGSNGGIRGVQRVFPAPPVSRGENAREGGFELCRQIKPAKGAAKPLRIRWIDTREKEYQAHQLAYLVRSDKSRAEFIADVTAPAHERLLVGKPSPLRCHQRPPQIGGVPTKTLTYGSDFAKSVMPDGAVRDSPQPAGWRRQPLDNG